MAPPRERRPTRAPASGCEAARRRAHIAQALKLKLALAPLSALALASGWSHSARAMGPTLPNTLENPIQVSSSCATCHNYPNAEQHADDPGYAPFTWLTSMMGQATIDPVFWAGVGVALGDQAEPDETTQCVRCHAPRAYLAGQGGATTLAEIDPLMRDGVACDVCHRMIEDPDVPAGNAMYTIHDGIDGSVPSFGPWTYSADEIVEHPTAADNPLLADSRMCGTCHDVTTPRERVDDAGVGLGVGFNEQRTYSEWLGSDFSREGDTFKSCADCHMPAVADVAGCRKFVEEGRSHATGGRRHDLVGANRFMLQLLRDLPASKGGSDDPDSFFDATLERMDEMLAKSAELEVEAPETVDLRQGLKLPVRVTNKSGHKLPTGYSEGRVMWLALELNMGEQTLYASGRFDPDASDWVDGIEGDAQIRRYEAIAENYAEGTQFHLLLNDHWIIDSRIPPAGLEPNLETDPVGDRYPLEGDGRWPNYDAFSYEFPTITIDDPTPDDTSDDEAQLDVKLFYLINTRSYIEVLERDNSVNDSGKIVAAAFDEMGGATPMVLAHFETTLKLEGLVRPGEDDTSSDDEQGSGSGDGDGDGDGDRDGDTSNNSATVGQEDTVDADGCGCRSRGATPTPWLAGLIVVLLGRGRRARHGPAANPPA